MNKTPYMYADRQIEELEKFMEESFGKRSDGIFHEIESEYVHTDTFVHKNEQKEKNFVTCGMGAREMNGIGKFKRCELVMMTSEEFAAMDENGMAIAGELAKLSKFPFREDTWLGTGHTINASKQFKETFGYDAFAFVKMPTSAKISDIDDEISFLLVVPIYKAERDWCMENHTLALLEKLNEKYDGFEFYADKKREPLIPDDMDEDEIMDYNVMTVLGIGREELEYLGKRLAEIEESGVEPTYDVISEILSENK